MILSSKKIFIIVFLFVVLSVVFSFFLFYREFLSYSRVDILVFAPHPDDETLCCGGTIIKAAEEGKRVKIVFLTSGDGFSSSASFLFGKETEELTPEDYIQLGRARQKEAVEAAKAMGLKENDLSFLGYPDGELSFIWNEFYSDYYLSEKTNAVFSPYGVEYNSRRGYTRENLVSDIKVLLEKYKPKKIFIPHILDEHKDHRAANGFVSLALDELRADASRVWPDSSEIFYYLIHNPGYGASSFWPDEKSSIIKEPDGFSQRVGRKEDISNAKIQKAEAVKKYQSQLLVPDEKKLIEAFSNKDNEIFWGIPGDREQWLSGKDSEALLGFSKNQTQWLLELEREWECVGNQLKQVGYNVNLGPVADVADDIHNLNNPLARRERIFSQEPLIVTQLARSVVSGLNNSGVIPVIKHFPGLGAAGSDTHAWLPEINLSKLELRQTHLLPFESLIKWKIPFWIMTTHAVYPAVSKEPASLSFEIQTELLRKEMGFEGIIISDELYVMAAMKKYAEREGLKEPFIGELAIRAFSAGTDVALFYLPYSTAEKIVSDIIQAVKKAVEDGKIKEEDINESLGRILGEKERIFNKPLKGLINEMSIEEKIGQKIVIDIWREQDFTLLKKYNLGGTRPYNEKFFEIMEDIQKTAVIPYFVFAQHEGGAVSQFQPDIFTKSAYLTGKEFEGLNKGKKIIEKPNENEEEIFEVLSRSRKEQIFNAIINSLDRAIELNLRVMESENDLICVDPVIIYPGSRFLDLVSYKEMPSEWLEAFPDEKTARIGYRILKDLFIEWLENEKRSNGKVKKDAISQLESLKEKVNEKAKTGFLDSNEIRVLFLATHPDDEDGEALAYFKHNFNAETYILLATKGEGGENKINPLSLKDLGRLRTEEMAKAGEILGVNGIFYLGAEDFGYCGLEEDALNKWNKEKTLKDIIYFYRLIKPHVIISKNVAIDEHCQHRAFISLAMRAFDMAPDLDIEPEMLKDGLSVWRPLKFYQRDFDNEHGIFIDSEEKSPFLTGQTYKEIALAALKQHKTQGFGDWPLSLMPDRVYYILEKSNAQDGEKSFFSGFKTSDL